MSNYHGVCRMEEGGSGMRKPRLLDLFCGAGGCTKGYQQAGFYVIGVDIAPQSHYCGDEFIQADAMIFPLDGFDVIHASPPCQGYSRSLGIARIHGRKEHPLLIRGIRERLEGSGKPWIIENVAFSDLPDALELCGSMFNLPIRRHRWFASSHLLFAPSPCCHVKGFYNPIGGKIRGYGVFASKTTYKDAQGNTRKREGYYTLAIGQAAMGIDWMSLKELSQAIPPAYTRWVGSQMMEYIQQQGKVEVA